MNDTNETSPKPQPILPATTSPTEPNEIKNENLPPAEPGTNSMPSTEVKTPTKLLTRNNEKENDPEGLNREYRYQHAEVRPHAFVVMPFGKKTGPDGHPFDFNAIYKILIRPAIEEAGFEPFRADEETASGDILTDMFQELLLADMVVCDLSIDNANAFYELGIRHAMRKRGVVHIQAGRAYMPFDIFNVRTLPYHITPEGLPHPDYIRTDIKAIARLIRDTWASDRDMVHSPIYNLLSGLQEPERKSLQTPLATGFWREYDEWKEKVTIAQRNKHIGDILLLTEEIKNPLIREEAVAEVGNALAKLGRNELALNQYREGIQVNADNLEFRREEAFHLNRVGRVNEAIVKLESILAEHPKDTKSISYLGRIYKEMWSKSWSRIGNQTKRMRTAFDSYHWLIQSIEIYLKGFQIDLRDFYPGINAFTLSYLAIYLADKFDSKNAPDPDIARIRKLLPSLQQTLQFTLESKLTIDQEKIDYWALVSMAELRLLTSGDIAEVVRSYRKAATALRRDLFSLRSSLQQLEMIKALGIRTDYVSACIRMIKEEIRHASTGDAGSLSITETSNGQKSRGNRAFIFAGYMIDYSGKDKRLFPPEKETEIRNEIRKRIEKLKHTSQDRAFLAGLSAGSEIIFAEACLDAGIKVKIFLPQTDAAYVRRFVSPGGESWVDRFYKIRNNPLVDEIYQPDHLGQPKEGNNLYERNCRWAIYSALGRVGIDNLHMITVASEFVGETKDRDITLTRYMIDMVRNLGGRVEEFINPGKFISSVIHSALDKMILENKPEKSLSNSKFIKRTTAKKS